jgi:hypothetical protein
MAGFLLVFPTFGAPTPPPVKRYGGALFAFLKKRVGDRSVNGDGTLLNNDR